MCFYILVTAQNILVKLMYNGTFTEFFPNKFRTYTYIYFQSVDCTLRLFFSLQLNYLVFVITA